MVGATRWRVNFFTNNFPELWRIEDNGSLNVRSSLLSVVLRD
jgi:hypothetical protein